MPPADGRVDIRPVSAERWADLVELFGERGASSGCWCMWFRVASKEWSRQGNAGNRAAMERIVADDRVPGLLAYRDGEPVGWVSLGPREDYARLQHSRVLAALDDRPVWSIVCFVVARKARKQGIANALLEAAIQFARQHGATLLEAYPVDTAGDSIPAANAYKGTLTMFERAGFAVAARRRANRSSPERPIVRRVV